MAANMTYNHELLVQSLRRLNRLNWIGMQTDSWVFLILHHVVIDEVTYPLLVATFTFADARETILLEKVPRARSCFLFQL